MTNFVKVLKVADLPPGEKKSVFALGKKIAVANVDGEFFAIDDTCTHQQCSLGDEGFLDGSILTCGCHGGQFDITTGKVLALPAPVDVASYRTKIEGDDVFVAI